MGLRTTPGGPAAGGGAAGGFQTQLHVMDSARAYVEHVGGVMVGEVNRLMGELESLNPSTWDGSAYRAFLNAKVQWQTAHTHLTKALTDIGMGLDDSRKQYDQADTDSELGITNAVRGLTF
jgi:WXG100 family type VII secretion target